MAIIPKPYINAVVAIGVLSGAEIKWCGTGFLAYRYADEQKEHVKPLLITNKHVFEKEQQVVIRLRKEDGETTVDVNAALYEDGVCLYKTHPNPNIDIAVLPLNGKYFEENHVAFFGFDIDEGNSMSSDQLREAGVSEGALIHMLGFPMGLVNETSPDPICRLGCIARMTTSQIQETQNILVDIQNFPGNSGSPIIVRPELLSVGNTKSNMKCVLLGIIHSYIPYQETLQNTQTKQIVEVRSENSGLAKVHPVEYIREVVDLIIAKPSTETPVEEEKEIV